jgi:hypothetical protein
LNRIKILSWRVRSMCQDRWSAVPEGLNSGDLYQKTVRCVWTCGEVLAVASCPDERGSGGW